MTRRESSASPPLVTRQSELQFPNDWLGSEAHYCGWRSYEMWSGLMSSAEGLFSRFLRVERVGCWERGKRMELLIMLFATSKRVPLRMKYILAVRLCVCNLFPLFFFRFVLSPSCTSRHFFSLLPLSRSLSQAGNYLAAPRRSPSRD